MRTARNGADRRVVSESAVIGLGANAQSARRALARGAFADRIARRMESSRT